ncbi:MAG: hypothetical protein ABSG43_21665 [Solirubrobacteraceae bacterium]
MNQPPMFARAPAPHVTRCSLHWPVRGDDRQPGRAGARLARGTVSTTRSGLTRSGHLQRTDRG